MNSITKTTHNNPLVAQQKAAATDIIFNHKGYEKNLAISNHAEKITQAIYMLTDLIDSDVEMRESLRSKSFRFLDAVYTAVSPDLDAAAQGIDVALFVSRELISYLSIAHYSKLISKMNLDMVVSQIEKSQQSLMSFIKDSSTTGSVEKKDIPHVDLDAFFAQTYQKDTTEPESEPVQSVVSEYPHSHSINFEKKTTLVPHKEKTSAIAKKPKKITLAKTNEAKKTRHTNILAALENNDGISATDICSLFGDCSSKTIQRDLNELIDNGLVRKEGSRRWSTYYLAA